MGTFAPVERAEIGEYELSRTVPVPARGSGGSDGTTNTHSPDSRSLAIPGLHIVALIAIATALVAVFTGSAQAAGASTVGCFDLTNTNASSYSRLTEGLGLDHQTEKAVQFRSANFYRRTGPQNWDGLGLTADQIAILGQRVVSIAKSLRPLGYPCAAFTHRTKTLAWVKETLVANGFRSASLRVTNAVPRQLQLTGIQDGIDVWIVVARKGLRGVTISLTTTHSGGSSTSFVLPFVP